GLPRGARHRCRSRCSGQNLGAPHRVSVAGALGRAAARAQGGPVALDLAGVGEPGRGRPGHLRPLSRGGAAGRDRGQARALLRRPRMRLIWRPTRSAEGVRRVGSRTITRRDVYHLLLTMPWRWFFGVQAVAYLIFNAVFALFYLAAPGSVA